jgi:hypothetical protein
MFSTQSRLDTLPMIPTTPWSLRAWPPILWQAGRESQLRFHHLSTRVTLPGDGSCRTAGQTIWGGRSDDGEAGVAWDWVQISGDVVAMADPMSVVTNLRLIGEEGEVLTALESARFLNEIVHALPWQCEVQRALHIGHA